MRRRTYAFLAIFVVSLGFLCPAGAQTLRINTASIRFNPTSTDQFQISGSLTGLSLASIDSIRLDTGLFSQTVPRESFSQTGQVLSYTGDAAQPGLSSLTVDFGLGTFSAKGSNLILSGLSNPLPVRLVAGPTSVCSMLRFYEDSPKLWKFNSSTEMQTACNLSDVPQADPPAFLVNTSTSVRFQARIFPHPQLDVNSVRLYEVDSSLNPVGTSLCQLRDNGQLTDGDDILNDGTFSCFASFLEPTPRTIRVIVRATIGGVTIWSPSVKLETTTPVTDAAASALISSQQSAAQIWQQKMAQFGDTLQARTAAVTAIRTLQGVQDAGISVDGVTIWIKYASGLTGGLMLNAPGTRGGSSPVPLGVRTSRTPVLQSSTPPASFSSQVVTAATPSTPDTPIENTNVLIWDAYNASFSPFDEGPDLRQLFEGSNCPKYTVTYLQDGQATVDSVKSFTQYGTVILVTHGAVDGSGQVVFLTDESTSLGSVVSHGIDLILGRLTILGDVFAIRPSFIRSLSGAFQNTVVYNGSCESSANNTMANAFFGKGAKTYYGYTKIVNSNFAQNVANQLFDNLVTDLHDTGDSFNPVTPKTDPTAPNAVFTQAGDSRVAYSGDFRNGSFESGDLTAWTRNGDGRVILQLGSFSPVEGSFMGIVSTGLGFTNSSGSIEQSFCLPRDATQLQFRWNFSSEEFQEWCGPQWGFDDPFQVELVTDSGTNLLFGTTIDDLCNQVTSTSLAFDQSGASCTPTPGVGFGTGGNDCTVWSTGWQSQTIDISSLATANDGKGVTLRFKNFDAGDSIFDSAVLLDKIEVVHP